MDAASLFLRSSFVQALFVRRRHTTSKEGFLLATTRVVVSRAKRRARRGISLSAEEETSRKRFRFGKRNEDLKFAPHTRRESSDGMGGPQPGEHHHGEDDDERDRVVVVPKVGAVLTFKNASRSEDARELERVFTSRGVKRASFLDVETTLGGDGSNGSASSSTTTTARNARYAR